jgi:hypothetical protein
MPEAGERDRIKDLVAGQGQVQVLGSVNYNTAASFSFLSHDGEYLVTVTRGTLAPAEEPAPPTPAPAEKPAPEKPAPAEKPAFAAAKIVKKAEADSVEKKADPPAGDETVTEKPSARVSRARKME